MPAPYITKDDGDICHCVSTATGFDVEIVLRVWRCAWRGGGSWCHFGQTLASD